MITDDPWCCDNEWDAICQDAYDLLTGDNTDCVVVPPAEVDINSTEYLQVITDDPSCCDVAWSGACQDAYDQLTGGNTDCVAIPPPGVDVNSAEYLQVITDDPWCCDNEWDAICQNAYDILTGNVDCAVVPPSPVDVTSDAYLQVILNDLYCCDTEWDQVCQDAYDQITGGGSGYCAAAAEMETAPMIAKVNLGTIENNTNSMAGYEDHTAFSTILYKGVEYPIEITSYQGGDEDQVLVWIDLDQNEQFNDDELVFASSINAGPIYTGNVLLGLDVPLGATRMRVRLVDTHDGSMYTNMPNTTPCGNSTSGQVEDYTILVDLQTGSFSGEAANSWSVYPNPGNGDLTIHYHGAAGMVEWQMFDMTARIVHQERSMMVEGERTEMRLAGKLAPGSYILRATTVSGRSEQRMIVR